MTSVEKEEKKKILFDAYIKLYAASVVNCEGMSPDVNEIDEMWHKVDRYVTRHYE